MRARRTRAPLVAVLALLPAAAPAQTLPEGAALLRQMAEARAETAFALSPWTEVGGLRLDHATGAVTTTSWRIPAAGLSVLDLAGNWQSELVEQGFALQFSCAVQSCGGFDFRFALPVFPEPDMHVDLGDFRYLVLRRDGAGGPQHRVLLISRDEGALFAQITEIAPAAPAPKPAPAAVQAAPAVAEAPVTAGAGDLIAGLTARGGAVLEDLVFAPGAAALEPGEYPSLTELGAWLLANPGQSVALVGHTDATGNPGANLALSQRRAQSVRAWLMERFALPAAQIGAEGVGALAPRATNSSPEGQARNRRVEVILALAP